jgi:hypothetical protein
MKTLNENNLLASYLESNGFEIDKELSDRGRFLFYKDEVDFRSQEDVTLNVFLCPRDYALIFISDGASYVLDLPEEKITTLGSTLFAGYVKTKSELEQILRMIGYPIQQPDPLAVDVFKGRCGTKLIWGAWEEVMTYKYGPKNINEMRLSDMPTLSELNQVHGVGKKSFTYYEDVMSQFGFEDKLK